MSDFFSQLESEIQRVADHLEILMNTREFYLSKVGALSTSTAIMATTEVASDARRDTASTDQETRDGSTFISPLASNVIPMVERKSRGGKRARRSEAPRMTSETKKAMIREIESLIESAGRPVSTQEILRYVTKRGYRIGGQRPANTLSARLSTCGNFTSTIYGWILSAAANSAQATR